jgi:hypothetical protein
MVRLHILVGDDLLLRIPPHRRALPFVLRAILVRRAAPGKRGGFATAELISMFSAM